MERSLIPSEVKMQRPMVRRGILLAALLAAAVPAIGTAQSGQVIGTVTDASTGQPLPAVQVYMQGLGRGTLTTQQGTFTLSGVAAGTYTLIGQRIGYQEVRQAVTVAADGSAPPLQLTMSPAVLSLQGVVATGLVDPVEGVRSPITVAQVTKEMMPVTVAGSAVQNLQGRVAGLSMTRSSFQPGGEINIMLRSPTSGAVAAMPAGTGDPLIVVDGVILGNAGTSSIESNDIESMEVIKGAAAASLYGSRAAAGVISITTSRGRELGLGQTQFSFRNEMGFSSMNRGTALRPPTHHQYLMNEARTSYVDLQGNPVDRTRRVTRPWEFMDKPYPGPIYDNFETVFQPGGFQTQTLSMSQNAQSTNFMVTLNRYLEEGVLENNKGFERGSLRVNLDHRFRETMSVGVSAYHSRDRRDELNLTFANIIRAPVDVDLRKKEENGEYIRIPDPDVAYENPLWTQASRENERNRSRTLASLNAKWDPTNWLSISGNVSYDHADMVTRSYTPKGTPISVTSDQESDGSLVYGNTRMDTGNGEVQASLRRNFGALNARTTFRLLGEFNRSERVDASATDFFVQGVPRLNAAANRSSSSEEDEVQALGYLWDTALDYDGKYIFTVLGRRDGSSLFGVDNRWHGYYRVAGAWRLSEEPWFALPRVDEFKLSYARGTAGGRPPFFAQYETWNVGSTGVSKGTLGNRDLRPEHTREQEVSLDMILFGRFGVKLTRAWQQTTEQLVLADVPSFTGYASRWTNGGTVEGWTNEFTLEAELMRRRNFNWTSVFIADRSDGRIKDWPGTCLNPTFRYVCGGEKIYSMWAGHRLKAFDGAYGLLTHHGGRLANHRDEFQVNDDGWLVWVGKGNNYTDHRWGTSTVIEGVRYEWGMTFDWIDEDGTRGRANLGEATHTNFGLVNNWRVGRLTFNAHMNASHGGKAFNLEDRTLMQSRQSPRMDQSSKPHELKKPVEYYESLIPFGNPQMEDISYLKLRALSASYRFSPDDLSRLRLTNLGFGSMTIGLAGRELFTWTNFTGPDPEMALNVADRGVLTTGGYPPARTVTLDVSLTF
jgi:TonB-linked SusC/RagA family outer membrane protein